MESVKISDIDCKLSAVAADMAALEDLFRKIKAGEPSADDRDKVLAYYGYIHCLYKLVEGINRDIQELQVDVDKLNMSHIGAEMARMKMEV